MAGVVKGVQQVVSSNGTAAPTANGATGNPCDSVAFGTDPVDNFSFAAEVNTNNDLLGLHPASTPSSDDLSLQDLIDSELALRISSGKAAAAGNQADGAQDGNQDALLLDLSDESEELDSVERRPPPHAHVNGHAAAVNGNLVSDFLDRERSHADDNDNAHAETDGEDSLSLSKSLSSAAPLCSGDGEDLDELDMASELGSDGPADSDFSANVPDEQPAPMAALGDALPEHDAEEEADEATLAEDISLASDRSQERTGSLLDLDPLRPDSPPGCGPGPGTAPGTGVGLVLGPTDAGTGTGPTGSAGTGSEQEPRREDPRQEQQEQDPVEAGEGEGRSTTPLGPRLEESDGPSAAAAATAAPHAQEQQEQDAEEAADIRDDDVGLLVQPLECPVLVPAVCVVDANPDAKAASSASSASDAEAEDRSNSMDSSVLSAVPSGPGPDPAGFEEGFETWSTVEEAVSDADLLAGTNGHVQDEVVAEAEPETCASPDLDTESVSETSEKKSVSKKKKTDGTESTKKKTRKSKKSDEKENISVKSSFSKFDQLSKKTVLHVRSVDAAKVQKQFNESASASPEAQTNCKACGKQVFVMEQIKAEKSVWHKNCFRCKECSKQLTVDIYSSNDGDIYCKPHFRELFKPKAVVEDSPEPIRRRKPELIIRENQPVELPPDVVRASDKPDLGLEELSSLNVKSRFQVFEKSEDRSFEMEKSPSNVNVKRSPSILSKLAKFQAKGMDIGVTDESLNGIPYEESSTSSEEEEDDDEEDGDIIKSRRATRERPMSFSKMEDVKSRWETGSAAKKEERREERKQEIQAIRSRVFMGKQGKMKEMYEQAVKESEQPAARRGAEVRSEKAKSIKEKFERGETLVSDGEDGEEGEKKIKDEDLGVFEAGISKKSRSHFMELDASAAKTQQTTPSRSVAKDGNKKREVLTSQVSSEVVKASDKIEDVQVETADISSKFKFFETYKAPEKQRKAFRITPPREGQVKAESPEREVYRDPDVVRADDSVEGDELQHSMTTSKMLSIFRQMEEKAQRDDVPDGPKPLKCFTPPPDYKEESDSSDERSDEEDDEEEDEEDEDENDGVIRSSVKAEDEFLKAAKEAAKAKTLRAKFEHWEEQENNINNGGGNINPTLLESEHESIESTKSLRARFESLRNEAEAPKEKPRPKVNRFVEIQTSCAEFCDSCEKKVYPLEKVETGGKLFHKGCFRCMQCSCILRMESYTLNNGKLYCIPHFKQLFISKGNYDEGFGLDQHKRKWNSTMKENGDILLSGIDANGNNH